MPDAEIFWSAARAYDLAAGTEVQVNCVASTGLQYIFNVTVLSGNLRGMTGNFEIPVQPQQLKAPWGTAPACPGES